ncbi:unnamed protein product, partial [Prorocentrum cordatum]
ATVPPDAPVAVYRVATANVQTLKPWQDKRSYACTTLALMNSKVQFLEQQFREAGFACVGLQEGRAAKSSRRDGVYYTMFAAAAEEGGSLGVQLWLDRDLGHHALQWRDVSPRIIFAVTVSKHHAVHVWISAHAPTSGATRDDRLAFWSELTSTGLKLKARFPQACWVVTLDANGRVGSVPSPAIGTAGAVAENENGESMKGFAEELNLVAVNTFTGGSPTWHSTKGTHHRIDYLLVRQSHQEWVSDVTVHADLDLTFNGWRDHDAVSAVLRVTQTDLCAAVRSPAPPRLDETHMADPSKVADFQRRILVPPMPQAPHVDDYLEQRRHQWFVRAAFDAWLAGLPAYRLCRVAVREGRLASPLVAHGVAVDSFNASARARKLEATYHAVILKLQRMANVSLQHDRQEFLAYQWPTQWCGGLLAHVHKQKGDVRVCDNSRGILLADHAGKGLASIVKDALNPSVNAQLPLTQFGAVSGRGADFATHIVLAAVELARQWQASLFLLFVDLVKAFDKLIRQLVLGWGGLPPSARPGHPEAPGVAPHAVRWFTKYIEERGHLFKQWKVNLSAADMARTLHEQAWFKLPGGSRVTASLTGGRQGCTLGSLVFNSAYTPPLDMLKWRLSQEGLTLRLTDAPIAFWADVDPPAPEQDIVDATFVDDEVVILLSESPKALARAVDTPLGIITDVFGAFHLEVNWGKGKTEGLVALRGNGAVAVQKGWRQPDGTLATFVPNSHQMLHIVDEYRHLGIFVSAQGVHFRNAVHRASAALGAYSPIAFKVFGSSVIDDKYKLVFMRSLVLSRLTFNLHVCVLSLRTLQELAGVYMRVLRRIAGDPRFSTKGEMTDLEVRLKLQMPSFDCPLMVARLRYFARLVRNR